MKHYVSVNGSDSYPASSTLNPWRTILRARQAAYRGDIIYLLAGTYTEKISTNDGVLRGGASWDSKLVIQAYPGHLVTLAPTADSVIRVATAESSYVEFADLDLNAESCSIDAVKITHSGPDDGRDASHHIRLRNCKIHGALNAQGVLMTGSHHNELVHCDIYNNGQAPSNKNHGVYISCPDNLIDRCDIHENGAYGAHFYHDEGVGGGVDRNLVRYTRFYLNDFRGGLLFASGKDNSAYRVTSWGNKWGIYLYHNSVNTLLEDCTVGLNTDSGVPDADLVIGTGATYTEHGTVRLQ